MSNKKLGDIRQSVFNEKIFNAVKEPMFLGESVNIARYDVQKYPFLEALINKQLSFFWRPEEIPLELDAGDYQKLSKSERRIFTSNLKYQILLDSVNGRSPNLAFLPVVSIPELETWIETWAFSETIHSRSYTHILRNIVADPSEFFDDILTEKEIVDRAKDVTTHYDSLINYVNYYNLYGFGVFEIKDTKSGEIITVDINKREMFKLIYLALTGVFILETIRFYVSFACSFAFAERRKMEGNAKIIKLIARDEALHGTAVRNLLMVMLDGQEGSLFREVALECQDEVDQMYKTAANQEKQWSRFLFADGSMIGLNHETLSLYIDYITNDRYRSVFERDILDKPIKSDPLPWMNHWLSGNAVQVANQEAESTNYVIGGIDNKMSDDYRDKIKNIEL